MIFFALNLLNWTKKASSAAPFATILAIFVLWCFLCVPSVCLGSYIGAQRRLASASQQTKLEPRRIPQQPWHRSLPVSMILGGFIPFLITFTELFFVLSSIWQHQYYFLFGFLALTVILLSITSIEVAIIITYRHLNGENYHWWWQSFLSTASTGIYVFLYSILYFHTRLDIKSVASSVLYFGFMGLISCVFSLVCGACGMIGTYIFLQLIYGSIHAREADLCVAGTLQGSVEGIEFSENRDGRLPVAANTAAKATPFLTTATTEASRRAMARTQPTNDARQGSLATEPDTSTSPTENSETQEVTPTTASLSNA